VRERGVQRSACRGLTKARGRLEGGAKLPALERRDGSIQETGRGGRKDRKTGRRHDRLSAGEAVFRFGSVEGGVSAVTHGDVVLAAATTTSLDTSDFAVWHGNSNLVDGHWTAVLPTPHQPRLRVLFPPMSTCAFNCQHRRPVLSCLAGCAGN
jgi:hypothetical protein